VYCWLLLHCYGGLLLLLLLLITVDYCCWIDRGVIVVLMERTFCWLLFHVSHLLVLTDCYDVTWRC